MTELNFILDDPRQIAVWVVCFVKHHGDLRSRVQVDRMMRLECPEKCAKVTAGFGAVLAWISNRRMNLQSTCMVYGDY